MTISPINHPSASSALSPSPLHSNSILDFFGCKGLALLARIDREFRGTVIAFAEQRIATMQTLPFHELCEFPRLKGCKKEVKNMRLIDSYLGSLSEIDFSNWDFANPSSPWENS